MPTGWDWFFMIIGALAIVYIFNDYLLPAYVDRQERHKEEQKKKEEKEAPKLKQAYDAAVEFLVSKLAEARRVWNIPEGAVRFVPEYSAPTTVIVEVSNADFGEIARKIRPAEILIRFYGDWGSGGGPDESATFSISDNVQISTRFPEGIVSEILIRRLGLPVEGTSDFSKEKGPFLLIGTSSCKLNWPKSSAVPV